MTDPDATMANLSTGNNDGNIGDTNLSSATKIPPATTVLTKGDKALSGEMTDHEMTKNDHNATTAEFKRAQDGASVLFDTADDVKALDGIDKASTVDATKGLLPRSLADSFDTAEPTEDVMMDAIGIAAAHPNKKINKSSDDDFVATPPRLKSTSSDFFATNDPNNLAPAADTTDDDYTFTKITNKKYKNKNEKENTNDTPIESPSTPTKTLDSQNDFDNKAVLIIVNGFKAHTAKWTSLSTASKNIMPYMQTDRSSLESELTTILKHYKVTPKLVSRDAWVEIFQKLPSLTTRKFRSLKNLGIKLAATDPTELLLPHEFNGIRMLNGRIPNAWAGAYTLYGPGFQPVISVGLDIEKGIAGTTMWWKQLDEAETRVTPFLPSEIFSDNPNSMHDQERHFRLKLLVNSPKEADPNDWKLAFSNCKDAISRTIIIKLALTPISVFGKEWFVDFEQKRLKSSSVTNFWIGAYRLAGAPWNLKQAPGVGVQPGFNSAWKTTSAVKRPAAFSPDSSNSTVAPRPTSPAPVTPASAMKKPNTDAALPRLPSDKGISFGAGTKSPGLFLSRSARAPKVEKKTKADSRKFEDVFYTIVTPPMEADWKDGGPEMTKYVNDATEHFFDRDRKAIVHMWSANATGKHTKKSAAMTSLTQAKKYASNLWLRQGMPSTFRFRVSHDSLPSLMSFEPTEDGELTVKVDHIQERACTTIGFLVGSSPSVANLEDMTEAHENHPVFTGLKLAAFEQSISLAPGKSLIPWKLQVKAVHIQVGESQAILAREKYNQVYGSRNSGGYPQGIHMRFVPDISDSRFPVTRSTRVKAIKMMSKQKVFLAQTKYIHTSTIAGIHILIPKIGYTLCQILMSIKSEADSSFGLFIAIDENFEHGIYTVVFTAHRDRFEEANAIVPLLCIVLEAKYGKSVWEWFTDDAKRVLTKYKWDPAEAKVVLIDPDDDDDGLDLDSDDEYMKSICDMMDIDADHVGNGFEFNIDFVVHEDVQPKNQYGDSGSVKTFRDAFDPDGGAAAEARDLTDDDSSNMGDAASSAIVDAPADVVDLSDETSTQATSMEHTLEQLIINNPGLAQHLLAKNSSTAVSPSQGVDGN